MTDDSHISALERLAKLKAEDAITDAEYMAQKSRLLGTEPQVPFYRKLWVVVLLTVLVLTMPVALLVLATGNVYRKTDDGLVPISGKSRAIYAGVLVIWLAGAFVNATLFPDTGFMGALERTAQTPPLSAKEPVQASKPEESKEAVKGEPQQAPAAEPTPQREAQSTADGPPACTDPAFRQTVLEAVDNGFDKAGLPREPEDEQAAGNLIELDGPLWLTARRSVVANSNGEIKLEEVRVCGTKDERGSVGLVTVIAVQHDGELGGAIQNTGLPSVIPFGKQF